MEGKMEFYRQGYHRGNYWYGCSISKELTNLREGNYRGLYTRRNRVTSICPKRSHGLYRFSKFVRSASPFGSNQSYLFYRTCLTSFGRVPLHDHPLHTY